MTDHDSWSAGERVGSYRLLDKLGAGGMGEVWSALDERLGRKVAIKRLLGEFLRRPEALARFEREARAQASLSNAHIATLHGLERQPRGDGTSDVFLVMELVEGRPLSAILADGALPIDEAMRLFGQLALALTVAHEAGIVHRDLKPSNLILRPDGTLVVVDFGIAVRSDRDPVGSSEITLPGTVVGSAAYMSPQQAKGERVGPEADIWSSGVTLYQMLAGTLPFDGSTASEVIASVLRDEPASLRSKRPDVPASVAELVERCLSKDVAYRYRNGAELLAAVPGLQIPVDGRRVGMLRPDVLASAHAHEPLTPRKRWLAFAVALLGVVAALSGASALWQDASGWLSPGQARVRADELVDRLGLDLGQHHRLAGYAKDEDGRMALWVRFRPQPFHIVAQLPDMHRPQLGFPREVRVMYTPQGELRSFERWLGPEVPEDVALPALLSAAGLMADGELRPVDDGEPGEARHGATLETFETPEGERFAVARLGPHLLHFERSGLSPPAVVDLPRPRRARPVGLIFSVVVLVLALAQLRRGVADVQGAIVLGMALFGLHFLYMLLTPEMMIYSGWRHHLSEAAGFGAYSGTLYVGVEPIVRRRWPGTLVGWERLLRWKHADHVIGRELLLGSAAAFPYNALAALIVHADPLGAKVREGVLATNGAVNSYLFACTVLVAVAVSVALSALFLSSLLSRIVRQDWLALGLGSAAMGLGVAVAHTRPNLVLAALATVLLAWLLRRGGLIAAATFVLAVLLPWLVAPPAVGRWTILPSSVSVLLSSGLALAGLLLSRRVGSVAVRSAHELSGETSTASTKTTRSVGQPAESAATSSREVERSDDDLRSQPTEPLSTPNPSPARSGVRGEGGPMSEVPETVKEGKR